ncbi:MAG: riboflavin synthase [Verrucomicrobia bacterium]|nr:riboflavin synthase [Verrucomicrobiota bacterium]
MFSGIIEETGSVLSFSQSEKAWRLIVSASVVTQQLQQGDSIAVNGCCLTAVTFDDEHIEFDLLEETVRLTNFRFLKTGSRVNLERSLRFDGKIGGHFVTGHVDAQGTVATIEPRGQDFFVRIEPPREFLKYLVYKGSIAIDGISLTVAAVDESGFSVWIIPHTLEVTNLGTRQSGDSVNLEFDLLAKYVERLIQPAR